MIPTKELLLRAKRAAARLGTQTAAQRAAALPAMADALLAAKDTILSENAKDLSAAEGAISAVMLDRLRLDEGRIRVMAQGIRQVAALPDPVGESIEEHRRDNGLLIRKVRVPLGVVAIIFESRPNVTADAAALAIKSGNVCVLRGGKEAAHSTAAIAAALRGALRDVGLDPDLIVPVEDASRDSAHELMRAEGLVDLLIPRGGAGLIRACVEQATVPCIQTGTGICHIYVDRAADEDMALAVIDNAKTSLVDRDIAAHFLPRLAARLCAPERPHPVELRLDPAAAAFISGTPAGPDDFDTEFLDYILAVAVVDDLDAAIRHIAAHSTHHSESIITADEAAAVRFTAAVDSAAVYVNASTRFTDGGEFGLG